MRRARTPRRLLEQLRDVGGRRRMSARQRWALVRFATWHWTMGLTWIDTPELSALVGKHATNIIAALVDRGLLLEQLGYTKGLERYALTPDGRALAAHLALLPEFNTSQHERQRRSRSVLA